MTQDKDKLVTIPGELHSAATGNVVASAKEIYDYDLDSKQSDLNADSPSYNVSNHHEHEVDGVVTNHYNFDEAVQLVPEALRVGGLKLTFISYNNEIESYTYNGISKEGFINEDKWSSNIGKYIENPEYLQVTLDSSNKIIDCINTDGTKTFKVGMYTEKINICGNEYYVSENPEWIRVITDNEGKIIAGIRNNGKTYISDLDDITKQQIFVYIYEELKNVKDINNTFYYTEDSEYVEVTTDSENKIICAIKNDGTKMVPGGIEIGGNNIEYIYDIENRKELTIDKDDKILSCRKDDGTLVIYTDLETQQIETQYIKASKIDVDDIYIHNTKLTDDTNIYIERPKFARINLYGQLPTDAGPERTPTEMKCEFIVDGSIKFCSKCKLSIQGHGSSGYEKHNFSIDFINANDEELSIKFGDMIGIDGYHLKGYYTDRTQVRGIGSAATWRYLVKHLDYPYNIINGLPMTSTYNDNEDSIYISDAKYSEDGFPLSLYVNDDFHGLYSIKLKKNRKNYAMEKSVKSEIFLDSITYTARLNEPFDYTDWEVKNPKLKNYEEGGEIKDASVLSDVVRFFDFTSDIENRYQEYSDYMNFPHWVLYIIFCELVAHWDTDGNNTELLTWDGKHWSICPYDMDNTFLLMDNAYLMRGTFWETFRNLYENDIKTLYTKLRKNRIIESGKLYDIFINYSQYIPRSVYYADMEKWGKNTDAYVYIQFIYECLEKRIEFLDSVWLING